MYEMKVEKKPMIRHGDTRRSSMPSPVLRSGNRFAGRDMKLGQLFCAGYWKRSSDAAVYELWCYTERV